MKTDDILKAARDRMEEAINADRRNREEALDDMECVAGRIWPDAVREHREAAGRAVITVNRFPQFVRQVTGDLRRLDPAIKVLPGDDASSNEIAQIYEGLIRQIEYNSDATTVYEGAAQHAAMCGMGAFRVLADYHDDMSFDQEIRLELIGNPFAVYWDPAARLPTREDAQYVFITEQMRERDFKAAYPDAAVIDAEHDGVTDGLEGWQSDGAVTVAEYIWREPVKGEIALTVTGQRLSDPGQIKAAKDAGLVVKSRKVDGHKIMWAKVTAKDVLEGPTELPCKYLPVIAVMGEEIPVGDEVVRTSVIRWAKDPGRLYNYYSSTMAEVLALQPKAPYIVTTKQIAGQEAQWQRAIDENLPYLVYTPDEKAPGRPQREQPPVVSQGVMAELMRAADDMKATTGIYDAALGNRSNESSGVAIRQRQSESDNATSIYADNLERAIGACGRVLVSMIPRIYDTPRTVRIVGPDKQEVAVPINQQVFNPVDNTTQAVNLLTEGSYTVRVAVGPNYATRRQETAQSMMQFVQAVPQAGAVAADLIAEAMDWPDADKLAERLKAVLPPGVAGQEADPQAQQQMQQQMQMQQAAQQVEMRKAQAEAMEAEAQAQEAQAKAKEAMAKAVMAEMQARAMMAGVQPAGTIRPY